MAVSRGLDEFSRRMLVVAETVARGAERTVRTAAMAADQVAVLATPVDKGRARAGWLASIGAPAEGEPEDTDKSGSATIAAAAGVVAQWHAGDAPIYITNNVPYIVDLDEGHSRQAPYGMSAQALQAARDVIQKAKLTSELK